MVRGFDVIQFDRELIVCLSDSPVHGTALYMEHAQLLRQPRGHKADSQELDAISSKIIPELDKSKETFIAQGLKA